MPHRVSNSVPSTAGIALVLHGRLATWTSSASRSQHMMGCGNGSAYVQSLLSAARFAHESIWEHVVLANERSGLRVRVYLHSWSPEAGALLSRLYQPQNSLHERPIPGLDKVRSQALSLSRALAMVPTTQDTALVVVTRYDLIFYRDLLLEGLLRERESTGLWLPQLCLQAVGLSPSDAVPMHTACGCVGSHRCSSQRQVTRGSLLEAPYLRWASARVRQSLGAAGYAFVDDRLFVATLPVAHSFATIYQHRPRYDSWLAQLANQSDWLKSGGALWMHYYFAVHIEMIVAREMGVGIGFLSVMSLRDVRVGGGHTPHNPRRPPPLSLGRCHSP